MPAFLLLGSQVDEQRTHHLQAVGQQRRQTAPGVLLGEDIALLHRPPGAAVLDRPGGCGPAPGMQDPVPCHHLVERGEDAGQLAPGLTDGVGRRRVEELRDLAAEGVELRIGAEVHRSPCFVRAAVPGGAGRHAADSYA